MRNDSVKEILSGARAGAQKDLDMQSQFHHMFFMGDMNYRLTMNIDDEPNETYEDTKKALVESKKKEKEEREARKKDSKGASEASAGDEEPKEELSEDKKAERNRNHQKILGWIKDENWQQLLQQDELLREVRKGRLLPGFTPCPVAFPPTFKRYRGGKALPKAGGEVDRCIHKKGSGYKLSASSATGSTASDCVDYFYNPQRYPAYTDRILYHSMDIYSNDLKFEHFDSAELLDTSDHKPVNAGFTITTHEAHKALRVNLDGKTVKTIGFRITDMKCTNLSALDLEVFGGGSDPYIVLSTDPVELMHKSKKNKLKSTTISHNLNPVWDPSEYLQFELVSNDVKGLSAHANLLVQVWDRDTITEDDLIGVAVVPMRDILANTNPSLESKGKHFSETEYIIKHDLYFGGKKQGEFECKIIRLPEPTGPSGSSKSPGGKIVNSQPSFVRRNVSLSEYQRQRSQHMVNTPCSCTIT